MNILELQKIMVDKGVTIRAIPKIYKERWTIGKFSESKIRKISENKNSTIIFDGLRYLEEITKRPENGGKFLIVSDCRNGSTIIFRNKKCYNTIEEAINEIIKLDNI